MVPSFPLMSDLPSVVTTRGWAWEQIKKSAHPSDGHWLATDADGRRWISKLRGSFYAHREIVFAKLAQAIGWSCQSSTYIRLDAASAETLGVTDGEVHAAHWYMDEHVATPCSPSCALRPLFGLEVRSVADLEGIEIAHLLDWPKSEFAAHIFGANDGIDRFITSQHEFVMIDNEQMFSTGPCSFDSVSWLRDHSDEAYRKGLAVAIETCVDVASITPAQLTEALAVPRGVKIDRSWPIASKIKQAIKFATAYHRVHAGAYV
jgi:hypothetical protein